MTKKTPLKSRVQSPGRHLLTPNDDDLERAQVRIARAAALRRKSGIGAEAGISPQLGASQDESSVLSKEHILELHSNCIKLAAENKITQRNTWDLKLIDHLSALVQGDDDEDDQTNFQKASCTLEAGVKIYSTRVDSVHTETYKVLGGLNRTAGDDNITETQEENEENGDGGEHNEEEHRKNSSKKINSMFGFETMIEKGSCTKKEGTAHNIVDEKMLTCCFVQTGSNSSTLEASFDTLNVKKFDVAFTVDPLFHQTSAQFDEGGAKGLLLNTLSVYQGCEIVFDSWEVPEKSMKAQPKNDAERKASINLSFMKDSIDSMMEKLLKEVEISPSLKEIVKMLDDPYRAATEADVAAKQSGTLENEDTESRWQDGNVGEEDDIVSEIFDHVDPNIYEEENGFNGGFDTGLNPAMDSWSEPTPGLEDDESDLGEGDIESPEDGSMMTQQTVDWITSGLSVSDKSNAWAGPDHWKYRKQRDAQTILEDGGMADIAATKTKRKKRQPFVLDFENPPEMDLSAFEPPPDPRSTLLVNRGVSVNTLLPEDLHYEALNLVRLFLRPSVLCIPKRQRRNADGQRNMHHSLQDFGNDLGNEDGMAGFGGFDGGWDDENGHGEMDEPFGENLVTAPRKVQKIDVNYDKTSKQVDVRILKETLWGGLQHIQIAADTEDEDVEDEEGIPFQRLLNVLPEDCTAAAREDLSVSLCFICLLHLANEHNLRITDCTTMDDLRIFQVDTNAPVESDVEDD